MRLRANLKTAFVVEPVPAPERQTQDKPESGRAKPPRCPHCNIDTLWYQSKLQRQNGSSKIVHSFHCPNCAMIVQTEEPSRQALRVI
jgi:hypothetical protein